MSPIAKLRPRIAEIDLLRGIAILAVMAIHTSPGGRYTLFKLTLDQTYFITANKLTRFAVPYFIILSGIALYTRYGGKKIEYFPFIRKRAATLLIPYTIFTAIYYYKFHITPGVRPTIQVFMMHLLRGSAAPHLYFVVVIMQLYILFPLFARSAEILKDQPTRIQAALLAGYALFIPLVVVKYRLLTLGFPTVLTVGHYFLLGCLIGAKLDNLNIFLKRNHRTFGFTTWFFGFYLFLEPSLLYRYPSYQGLAFNFYFLGMTGFSLSLFAISWKHCSPPKSTLLRRHLAGLGRLSYSLYLIHFLLVKSIGLLVPFPSYSGLHSIVYFIMVLLTSYAIIHTFRLNRVAALALGIPYFPLTDKT